MKIILQESFSNKKLKNEQIFIWNAIQDKLRVLHKELLADPRVNPELTIPQWFVFVLVRCWLTSLNFISLATTEK